MLEFLIINLWLLDSVEYNGFQASHLHTGSGPGIVAIHIVHRPRVVGIFYLREADPSWMPPIN